MNGEASIVSGMAGRYASALFELALEEKALDAVKADLERFDSLVASSPDLARLVRSPVFRADEQVRALSAVLARAGITGLAANFLLLVAKKRRLFAVRDMIKVRLKGDGAGLLERRNLGYDSGFMLEPGEYVLKFVARENMTGKIGTFETKFTVPDLAAEPRWLRTSSVVWANQREPVQAAVGGAGTSRRLAAFHPLVQDRQKLIPSITRVYRTDQQIYVYAEVYDPAIDAAGKPSVTATLALFRAGRKVFESEMLRVTETLPRRAFVVPVQARIPAARLKPGRYTGQVTMIDELGRKFAFARAPLVVID